MSKFSLAASLMPSRIFLIPVSASVPAAAARGARATRARERREDVILPVTPAPSAAVRDRVNADMTMIGACVRASVKRRRRATLDSRARVCRPTDARERTRRSTHARASTGSRARRVGWIDE